MPWVVMIQGFLIGGILMFRHLKNFNELVLYASISCGLSYFARVNPLYFYPVLLFRLCVLGYSVYIISGVEGNKVFATLLMSAVAVGLVGGYWDLIELYLRFDPASLVMIPVLFLGLPLIISGLWMQYKGGGDAR